ncbi:MAG: GGDEF domain-containing protein, partial [Comamonas sp.]
DSFGHAGGDELLRAFSQTLTRVLRVQDIVGRMGGEEFAVVLPQLDREASVEIAERINQATRELRVPTVHGVITATVSIGLVHITSLGQHQSLDALLQHADQALYDAKTSGRDRFKARLW